MKGKFEMAIQAFMHDNVRHLDGMPIQVIGKEDLISNKLASGRPKDWIDLEELGKL